MAEDSFPEGTANKETSSSFESEPETNSLSSMLEPPLSSSSPSIIPSTETFISQEKTTVYATVYEYPDATETATVTEIDTSYGFTFEPGSVLISTDAFDAQSTITLTAYAQDYVLSGTTVTPSVSYTTEYVTLTTTIEPLNGLQPSTMLTTVTTTSTDTVTVTESTNAPEVLSTAISDNYTTETSTSIEISLQTEALWTQKLISSTSTETLTMRSLDRFQPYYLSTQVLYSTATITSYTTTTTQAPANNPAPAQDPPPEQAPPPAETTPTTTTEDLKDPCAGNRFYRLNQIC
ncbi:hypothetical protein IW138_005916 [Coemansia sp. RSA 986]|nr:hypothetical protein IW138_005916 [Coemansia sp. RSA 986]